MKFKNLLLTYILIACQLKALASDDISKWKTLIEKDPSKVSYYFNLANSYYRNKMYPEAASEYKNVILKDPKLAYAAKYYLSQVLYYDKKLKEAIKIVDSIIKDANTPENIKEGSYQVKRLIYNIDKDGLELFEKGLKSYYQKNYNLALKIFNISERLYGYQNSIFMQGLIYYQQKNINKAQVYFSKVTDPELIEEIDSLLLSDEDDSENDEEKTTYILDIGINGGYNNNPESSNAQEMQEYGYSITSDYQISVDSTFGFYLLNKEDKYSYLSFDVSFSDFKNTSGSRYLSGTLNLPLSLSYENDTLYLAAAYSYDVYDNTPYMKNLNSTISYTFDFEPMSYTFKFYYNNSNPVDSSSYYMKGNTYEFNLSASYSFLEINELSIGASYSIDKLSDDEYYTNSNTNYSFTLSYNYYGKLFELSLSLYSNYKIYVIDDSSFSRIDFLMSPSVTLGYNISDSFQINSTTSYNKNSSNQDDDSSRASYNQLTSIFGISWSL
jgi:hypothetical protein